MTRRKRLNLVGGLALILLGIWFLAVQFRPELGLWINIEWSWPLFVVAAGVFLFVLGLLTGEPDMAVPASVVGGIGILLYWQNATGNWGSWVYAWTLIPGLAGIGTILSGLLGGGFRKALRDGGGLVVISLILFMIFASLLGGPNLLGDYWPVLLIALGLWMLVRLFLRPGSES